MKIKFIQDSSLENENIQIEIRASQEDDQVKSIINYLHNFGKKNRNLIPVKTSDRIITIKFQNLIKVEVQGTTLTFYTTNQEIKTSGRLYQVLSNLNDDFIQVSRHSVININYLESIETGFAGGMIAILAHNLRANVSRRYLASLEKELGI